MLRRALAFLDRHTQGWKILVCLALSMVLGVLPLMFAVARIRAQAPDAAPLDTQPGYSPDEAYAMIATYGADIRRFYVINAFTFDLVGPALFNLTFALVMALLLRRLQPPESPGRALAVVLPLSALVTDAAENVLLAIIVARYPERMDAVVRVASGVTLVKRALALSTMGAIPLLGLAVLARRALRRRVR